MPDKHCLIIQHAEAAGPGRIAEVLGALGWRSTTVAAFAGDPIPPRMPEGTAALVVLGGPLSVRDEADHPFLADAKRLLERAIAEDVPTLAVGFGAQLLAHVAGARVVTGVKPEIGWQPVALTDKGEADGLFGRTLPAAFRAYQRHRETFDLPRGAVHLAKSAMYTRQAFRLGENVYGVQFHPEMSPALWEAWGPHPPEVLAQDPAQRLAESEPWAGRLFRLFFERTGAR
jgi:GMP synthase-like glutamine amidotransferase